MVTDPSEIDTPEQLATSLDELRRKLDLSYADLAGRARRLPLRNGRQQALPKSTLSDLFSRRSRPSKDTLLTFLDACQVTDSDRRVWLSAWERASTVDLRQPAGAVRVQDARAWHLGVHPAIEVAGADTELPAYVRRDFDDPLRELLRAAAKTGGFVLLVGGSSVGKTRSLFEAARDVLPDWWLAAPTGPTSLYCWPRRQLLGR